MAMDQADHDEALYDAREYLIAGLANQAEWWEHLGDAHRDYAALARAAASLQSRYEFDAHIPLEDLRECITYLIEAVGEWFAGDVPPQLANDWRFKRAEEAVRVQT